MDALSLLAPAGSRGIPLTELAAVLALLAQIPPPTQLVNLPTPQGVLEDFQRQGVTQGGLDTNINIDQPPVFQPLSIPPINITLPETPAPTGGLPEPPPAGISEAPSLSGSGPHMIQGVQFNSGMGGVSGLSGGAATVPLDPWGSRSSLIGGRPYTTGFGAPGNRYNMPGLTPYTPGMSIGADIIGTPPKGSVGINPPPVTGGPETPYLPPLTGGPEGPPVPPPVTGGPETPFPTLGALPRPPANIPGGQFGNVIGGQVIDPRTGRPYGTPPGRPYRL